MSPVSDKRARWSAARKERVGRAVFVVCVLLIIAGLIAYGIVARPKDYWPAFVACVLGALLAIAELVARYRDDPAAAVLSWPAAVYVGVNATAAGIALYVIHVFRWTFGANGSALVAVQVLTAGLGSAALFRASVFNVTAGDRVIGIGPSEILNVILTAADRAVDRRRALIRATKAAQIMKGLTFEGSAEALLAYCVATMQNVTPDEVRVVEAKISTLRDRKSDALHDTVKLYILGLSLVSLVGDRVLEKASDQLREIFNATAASRPPAAEKVAMVMQALAEKAGPMSLYDLRSQVGLGLDESYIIDELQQQGVVTITGADGNETIEIAAGDRNGHIAARPGAPGAEQHTADDTQHVTPLSCRGLTVCCASADAGWSTGCPARIPARLCSTFTAHPRRAQRWATTSRACWKSRASTRAATTSHRGRRGNAKPRCWPSSRAESGRQHLIRSPHPGRGEAGQRSAW